MVKIEEIIRIARIEFIDIVKNIIKLNNKVRIILINDSFIDIYLSMFFENRFGFHWEVRDDKNTIFRYDNYPNTKWKNKSTYPYHFHNSTQNNVIASEKFSRDVKIGFRQFMTFVKSKM